MGYWPRATLTYGYTFPTSYDAEWLEDDAPEEAATAIIRNLVPATEIAVICTPDGDYRLIRYEEQVTGGRGGAGEADLGDLAVTDTDKEELREVAKLFGLDFADTTPTWHLSAEYI